VELSFNHDFRVHFGLNDATKIDSLEIRWPSGRVQTIKPQTRSVLFRMEGSGIVDRDKIVPKKRRPPFLGRASYGGSGMVF
jgi:hypothetical protein